MPRTVHTAPVIGLIPIPVMMSLAAAEKVKKVNERKTGGTSVDEWKKCCGLFLCMQ